MRRIGALVIAFLASFFGFVALSPSEIATEPVPSPAPTVTPAPTATPTAAPSATPVPTATQLPTPYPTFTPTPDPDWVSVHAPRPPWEEQVAGVLTFRGAPTRDYHGEGPVPADPTVAWSYPGRNMCGPSTVGTETTTWCGLGWTGQPAVWERDGEVWVAFGAYDYGVHIIDGTTGEDRLPPFRTGDIIKGSVTVDPDGYPLIYTGSRDGFLRALSFDQGEIRELWKLDARSIQPRLWNDDWDGSPLIIDDYLFEGGENSNLHIVKLNRNYNDDGFVTLDPELVVVEPGWDDELLAAVGRNVSIESSVAIYKSTLWFANSGGLVQGWDIAGLADGVAPERIFRFWIGDDTDATLVIDDEGFVYAAAEYERGNQRSREVGQLVKLDPTKPDDPIVWSVDDHGRLNGGFWATPAVVGSMVYASTDSGRLLGIDRESGELLWEKQLAGPLWSSQVVVDDVLIQGECSGHLSAFDISDPGVDPPQLWRLPVGGCIEATPVVWKGRIYVATRAGQFHMLEDVGG